MTHNFKTGVTYKTRGGDKAWFIGERVGKGYSYPLIFDHQNSSVNFHRYDGKCAPDYNMPEDIIGLWEESPEEIDVANMWVAIVRHKTNGSIVAQRRMYVEKPSTMPSDAIAFIRVSEWEAIKRGERKLKIGEGL